MEESSHFKFYSILVQLIWADMKGISKGEKAESLDVQYPLNFVKVLKPLTTRKP